MPSVVAATIDLMVGICAEYERSDSVSWVGDVVKLLGCFEGSPLLTEESVDAFLNMGPSSESYGKQIDRIVKVYCRIKFS